jgi:signal transduction histidine kinase
VARQARDEIAFLASVLEAATADGLMVVDLDVRESAERLTLQVADDGVGFDLHTALPAAVMRRHFGLATMRERVRLAGGEVVVDSAAGRGTTLTLTLPRTRGR